MVTLVMELDALASNQTELLQLILSISPQIEKEEGCQSSSVHQNLEEDTAYTLISTWKTETDLNHYLRSAVFSVLKGAETLLTRPSDISINKQVPQSKDGWYQIGYDV
jgi:quinol monooxygenase YgiN